MQKLNASIKEKQDVSFIFDKTKSLKGINQLKIKKYKKIFIIYDKGLKTIWIDQIVTKININTKIIFIPLIAVEKVKNIDSLLRLINRLEKNYCSKSDLIISIGGGTILDVTGFVASVFMRGIDLVMIPTTLMGQADASSAGKTCINGKNTKNLLGTLYMPKYVYNNIEILKTSSEHSFRQGMSEMFKYGLLGSKKLLNLLDNYSVKPNNTTMVSILKETVKVRIRLRKIDPLVSNLGHTFGHAFETESKNKVAHGDAISVGILFSLKLSVDKGYISNKLFYKIFHLMQKLKLNVKIDASINLEKIIEFMKRDKKSDGNRIGFVLLKSIGNINLNCRDGFTFLKPTYVKLFMKNYISKENMRTKNHWNNLLKNKIC